MQVDFTTLRRRSHKLKAFVATLGYSRAAYVRLSDSTLADAIMDRLVHNAYKVNLKGESLRKKRQS